MTESLAVFDLTGRVAVVTGVLGRLGPTWCRALVEAGAAVVGIDQPDAPPSDAFDRLVADAGAERVRLLRADILDRPALERAREDCLGSVGVPGILVNNAGIDQPPVVDGPQHRIDEVPSAAFQRILQVNVAGTFLVTQVFGPPMVDAGRGSIVNIGSLYASVAPDQRLYDHLEADPPFLKPPAYGASKAAVVNLTRYLAALWGPLGVRVNAISPGGVRGDQDPAFQRKFCERVPLRRMAEPADLVGPLLFLASDASSYVTGTELVVDGGFTAW